MSERFSILGAMFFSITMLVKRPIHFIVFFASITLLPWLAAMGFEAMTGQNLLLLIGEWFQAKIIALSDPDASTAMNLSGFLQLWSTIMLVYLGLLTIVYAAVNRILVRERATWWLPLQLGMDELRYLVVHLVIFAISIVVMIGSVILMIPLSFITAAVSGPMLSSGDVGSIMMIGLIIQLPIIVLMLYVYGRLLPMYTLTTRAGKIRLDSWSVTSGQGLKILVATGVPYLVMLALTFWIQADLMAQITNPNEVMDFTAVFTDTRMLSLHAVSLLLTFVLMGPNAYVAVWNARNEGG